MEALHGAAPARGLHRRSLSAPSLHAALDALTEQALSLQTSPCSTAQLHALDDEVAASLRHTLQEAQRELLAAAVGGALSRPPAAAGSRRTSDSGEAASDGDERRHSGGGDSASGSGGGRGKAVPADEFVVDETELAGLSAREREAAIKRARNREAARRSRERKVGRIQGLQGEVDKLRSNNFVLLKCIEEVAQKALAARAEQKQLQERLARLTAGRPHALLPGLAAAPGSPACTPPPAVRAAALERELLRMEAEAESPTQLLLPRWPDRCDAACAPAPAPHPRHQQLPTSAELRRQLQEAVAGGSSSSGGSAGSSGEKRAAADHHHLHPSPGASHERQLRQLQLLQLEAAGLAPPQQLRHQAVLHVKQQGAPEGLLRSCSAPGGLLAGAAAGVSVAAPGPGAAPDASHQHWFRGVAA